MQNPFERSVSRRTVLRTAGTAAGTLALGGVAAADCGGSYVHTSSGHLSGFGDSDCYYVDYADGGPCYVDLWLTSDATDADFDLYANLDSSCPSTLFYDYASDTPDEDARITIYDPDPEMDALSVLVYAEHGSGDYSLAIETHLA